MLHALNKGKEQQVFPESRKQKQEKKSCIRKLIRTNGEETTAPDTIMNEIHSFYSELYDEKSGIQINSSTCPFVEDN